MTEAEKKRAEKFRINERGDASQLIGMTKAYTAEGVEIPLLDEDGAEIVAIATGELYLPPELRAEDIKG